MSEVGIKVLIKGGQVYIRKGQELKPQPISVRPGYDMEYCRSMIGHYYPNFYQINPQFCNNEKGYDRLSIIRQDETPVQWRIRVMNDIYTLLTQEKLSVYHRFCLFAGIGRGKFDAEHINYERPEIHNSNVALCFRCWKLFRANDVIPKNSYHHGWREMIKMIESEDLMQKHWDFECDNPLTDFGRERVEQQRFALTPSITTQHDYTNLGTLSAYFKSMQKGANL